MRAITWIVHVISGLSAIIVIGGIFGGIERFSGFVIAALALDHWYPPVMEATPDQITLASRITFALALVIFALYAAAAVGRLFSHSSGITQFFDDIAEMIGDVIRSLFRRPAITRGQRKAIERTADLYDDEGRFGVTIGAEAEITREDLPELIKSIADEERNNPTHEFGQGRNYAEDFSRAAAIEISQTTDYPAVEVPGLDPRQTRTAVRWLADRDIYLDIRYNLAFAYDGAIKPELLGLTIDTLNAAEKSVRAIPSGNPKWVLSRRKDFETCAEALSVARGYHHDDAIPESKDRIIDWALDAVKNGTEQ